MNEVNNVEYQPSHAEPRIQEISLNLSGAGNTRRKIQCFYPEVEMDKKQAAEHRLPHCNDRSATHSEGSKNWGKDAKVRTIMKMDHDHLAPMRRTC